MWNASFELSVVFCTRFAWVCLICLLLCKEECTFTERRCIGLYEVPLSMYLLGFEIWTMLANFHMCVIMLVLRAVFNKLVRNASPRGPMCYRCLMFYLSGPCELLFLICCDVISLYFMCCSVSVSVCLVCCVFVNCWVKQFAICLGVVAILLLNVMDVFSVGGGGGALLDIPCIVFQKCVLCL